MGRSFTQRFKEHRNTFKSSRNNSNFAKHALEHSHPFGPIHETVQILQYQGMGAHLNTIERYEGRTESYEQPFFACKPGIADEGEYGGRWNQLLCCP